MQFLKHAFNSVDFEHTSKNVVFEGVGGSIVLLFGLQVCVSRGRLCYFSRFKLGGRGGRLCYFSVLNVRPGGGSIVYVFFEACVKYMRIKGVRHKVWVLAHVSKWLPSPNRARTNLKVNCTENARDV